MKTESTTAQSRKVWIDWMKTIGMLTIIWGHCFPERMSAFIYAFNVPVFFLISGYLTHQESSMRVCWNKMFYNLVIPYFILAFIKAAGYIFHHLSDGQWLWSCLAILGGFHRLHDASGCSNLWFVYTLILIRFIYQAFPLKHLTLSLISIAGTIIYNHADMELAWAVTNVLIALPFFMLCNALNPMGGVEIWAGKIQTMSNGRWILVFLSSMAFTYFSSYYNDSAMMYKGLYGNSLLLFEVASITGCFMVYWLSSRLNAYNWKLVRISSVGSMVTLVFHRELLHPLIKWINKMDMDIVTENIALFLSSVLVLLAFVPIILVVKRLFPIVLGKRVKTL